MYFQDILRECVEICARVIESLFCECMSVCYMFCLSVRYIPPSNMFSLSRLPSCPFRNTHFAQVSSGGAMKELDLFSFLQTDMTKQVLLGLGVPYTAQGETLTTYKIMPRHTNAHAYINAAFRIRLDSSQAG